jgi:hypothetical protein
LDPVIESLNQSFVAPLAAAGRVPHLLTAMIPWTDATRDERTGSVAVLGCDHAIWVMEGDLGAGGSVYMKTDSMGIATGQHPYAVSPLGTLYFINDDGQFCMWSLGGHPQSMSEGRVDQRFRAIDLGTYQPFLTYDRRARGVHVFLVPWAPTHAVRVEHYFFCEESHGIKELGVGKSGAFGSFWPTTFAVAEIQPLCALVRDGDDPGDRVLLLGGSDGYIRAMSGVYDDDDGHLIASEVVYGPLMPEGMDRQALFTGYQLELAEGQYGAQAQVFCHQSAKESMGSPVASFQVDPGLNDRHYQPVRGAYCYLKVASPMRFSMEGVFCDVVSAGMKRRRA